MNKQLRDKWIKALRSGKYKQTTGVLKSGDHYCCLGVLCKVAGKRINAEEMNLDNRPVLRKLRDALELGEEKDMNVQCVLTGMNDDGKSFKTIANWIARNVRASK